MDIHRVLSTQHLDMDEEWETVESFRLVGEWLRSVVYVLLGRGWFAVWFADVLFVLLVVALYPDPPL